MSIYTDTKFFWKPFKLSDFWEINPRIALKAKETYSFIEMKDLYEGQRNAYPSQERILGGGARFTEGDTLFARITPCLENGKICQAKGLRKGVGFGSTEFHVFKERKGISDKNFIFYLSRWEEVRRYAELHLVGTSGRQRVPKDVFEKLELNLPDLPTQRRIAEILSALDDKIELNRRMNQTLEQIAQTLFRHYFVEGIDEDNLPEGWKWGKLKNVSRNLRKSVTPGEMGEDINYVGLEHIPRQTIALYEWASSEGVESNKYRFKEDQILFGKLRPYFHKVVLAPIEGVCSTDILVIEPAMDYLLSFCLLHYSSKEVVEYANMLSSGTRMPRADWKGLSEYEIAIPPPDVLVSFHKQISPLLSKIKLNIQEINTLAQTRDTLLPKLMSGEIDVMQVQKQYEPVLS